MECRSVCAVRTSDRCKTSNFQRTWQPDPLQLGCTTCALRSSDGLDRDFNIARDDGVLCKPSCLSADSSAFVFALSRNVFRGRTCGGQQETLLGIMMDVRIITCRPEHECDTCLDWNAGVNGKIKSSDYSVKALSHMPNSSWQSFLGRYVSQISHRFFATLCSRHHFIAQHNRPIWRMTDFLSKMATPLNRLWAPRTRASTCSICQEKSAT